MEIFLGGVGGGEEEEEEGERGTIVDSFYFIAPKFFN